LKRWSIYIISLLFLPALYTAGQTPVIERLKKSILQAGSEPEKLRAILTLCDQGYTLHSDTLMLYAEKAKQLALDQHNLHDEVEAMYYYSYALTNKGQIDSSLNVANRCLEILDAKVNDPVLQVKLLNQKGRCYMRKNQYRDAIDMGYQVISGAEKSRDTLLQMMGKTLVGWAYLEMGQQREALSWHLRAFETTKNQLLLEKYSILFANLSINYRNLGKPDSAFYFINRAVSYSRKHQNLFALSNSLAIQAQLYVRSGEARQAEEMLKEAVEIRKLIGDPFYIVSDMSQLGLYYAHNGQPEKGIAICNEGIAIANEYKIDTKLFFLYSTLAENYKVAGDHAKHAETLSKIISLKDSVYEKNSAVALAEMQTKYELQKKENTNIQLELNLTRKNYLFYGSILLSALTALSAYLIFKNYRRKEKMKMELALAEEKMQAEKGISEAEEKERKRIAADLHDNLGAYAASIASNLDSISFANDNPDNLIAIQELRNNSQAIVSQLNDTIWALKKETLSLTAISDRIKIFVQRIQPSYPEVMIDIRENIMNDFRLQPIQAFHLFRIVQEAINNALRHSGCKQIFVDIMANRSWYVSIQDDGRGMQNGKVRTHKTGNGLSNMEARAFESGWEIRWKADPGNGTKVIIESEVGL
jgi:signal transduction histidine kinase